MRRMMEAPELRTIGGGLGLLLVFAVLVAAALVGKYWTREFEFSQLPQMMLRAVLYRLALHAQHPDASSRTLAGLERAARLVLPRCRAWTGAAGRGGSAPGGGCRPPRPYGPRSVCRRRSPRQTCLTP